MRHSILTIFLSLACFSSAVAQQYEYEDVDAKPDRHHKKNHNTQRSVSKNGELRFGAYIAPSLCWMHPTTGKSDDGNYSVKSEGSKIGYTWGLLMDYYFAENYGIATGFNLNTSGGIISTAYAGTKPVTGYVPITVYDTRFNYNLQYLEIPINLKLRSDELSGGIRVFGQIGVSIGFNLSKKASYTVHYSDSTGTTLQEVTGKNERLKGTLAVPPVNLSLNVGGGIEYPISQKLSIYAGLFFNNGFAPDATNPANYDLGYKGTFRDANTRLNNFALRVGILF